FLNCIFLSYYSCVLVGPEIPDYRVQGEAVIIRFPFLEDAVNNRRLQQYIVWVTIIHFSFMSDTFCLTGSVTVMIYEEEEPNITVMPYTARAGEDTDIVCPHLKCFKSSENPKWYKDFQSTALPIGRGQYTVERGIILAIRNISVRDEGFYTCRLSVIFNNTQYNVTNDDIFSFSVPVSEAVTSNSLSAFTSSSHSFPYIVFPANGSFIESHLGARLVIQCMVSVGNQLAQSTDVTWLVNDQPPENSDLATPEASCKHLEVQLVVLELLEEDNGTELKCICQNKEQKQQVVTQIKLEGGYPVFCCGILCFMLVLCAFAYHLCRRPQKPREYVLARQHSAI
uniref:Ig-like domain-containing protein n=1 Tax=Sinocyclocheilus grahami TaxID=75366 RepID=A0A672N8B5_SINGR